MPEQNQQLPDTAEHERLAAANCGEQAWRRWGPYLSERQWGTVREDYSPHGDAWNELSHDQARSRAYRWGEDGLAGISDDQQRLCLALALWNGQDPILKERLFGLTNGQGNHGEDVKELYYYLDATPTHAYLKMLYKYPQREFPYQLLTEENGRRGKQHLEFELLDSGVFDENRYFDVFIEYAKAETDDLLMTINEVADELSRRLSRIFLKDEQGQRPVFGHYETLQNDPHFRDCVLFYEYFHGDNGRGVGASHQTGWTGLVAKLLQPRRPPS